MGQHNLSINEIYLRYMLMAVFVIGGGILGSTTVMLISFPIFMTAILGWCPLYQALGINHHSSPH